MEIATWILVIILSITLLIFLIVGIVLLAKLIGIANEARELVERGQDIADNANGIASNIKGMTSLGGVVQTFVDDYVVPKLNKIEKGVKNGGKGKSKPESEDE